MSRKEVGFLAKDSMLYLALAGCSDLWMETLLPLDVIGRIMHVQAEEAVSLPIHRIE